MRSQSGMWSKSEVAECMMKEDRDIFRGLREA